MGIKINFVIDYRLYVGNIVHWVMRLEHADYGTVQLRQVVGDILKITFVLIIYLNTKHITDFCNYSLCHFIYLNATTFPFVFIIILKHIINKRNNNKCNEGYDFSSSPSYND